MYPFSLWLFTCLVVPRFCALYHFTRRSSLSLYCLGVRRHSSSSSPIFSCSHLSLKLHMWASPTVPLPCAKFSSFHFTLVEESKDHSSELKPQLVIHLQWRLCKWRKNPETASLRHWLAQHQVQTRILWFEMRMRLSLPQVSTLTDHQNIWAFHEAVWCMN